MGGFGGFEIAILVGVLILLFGAKKIPELARGIGEGMTEFKKATKEELDDSDKEKNDQSTSHEVKQSKTD